MSYRRVKWWKAIEWAAKHPKELIRYNGDEYFFNFHTAATNDDVKVCLCKKEMHKEYATCLVIRDDMLNDRWEIVEENNL